MKANEEKRIRVFLFNTYGGECRYGGDGELQGEFGMDFKRMPMNELLDAIEQAQLKRYIVKDSTPPKPDELCKCDREHGYNITGTIEKGRCVKVVCNICGKLVSKPDEPQGRGCGDRERLLKLIHSVYGYCHHTTHKGDCADILADKIMDAKCRICNSEPQGKCPADILDVLKELMDLMDAVHNHEYTPDGFTTQPARGMLEKYGSGLATKEGKGMPYGELCHECIANGDIKSAQQMMESVVAELNNELQKSILEVEVLRARGDCFYKDLQSKDKRIKELEDIIKQRNEI